MLETGIAGVIGTNVVEEQPASTETIINGRKVEWRKFGETPALSIKDIPLPEETREALGFPETVTTFDFLTFAVSESVRNPSAETFSKPLDQNQLRGFSVGEHFLTDTVDLGLSIVVAKTLKGDSRALMAQELAERNAEKFLLIDGHGWDGTISEQTSVQSVPIEGVLKEVDTGEYPVIWMTHCQSPEIPINGNSHATVFHVSGEAKLDNDSTTLMVKPPVLK